MTKPIKNRRMSRPPLVAGDGGINADATAESEQGSNLPARITKQGQVLELLCRDGGAPLSAIIAATGWLPHTARAALTGLRKKGHAIARNKVDGVTRYSMAAGAVE